MTQSPCGVPHGLLRCLHLDNRGKRKFFVNPLQIEQDAL